MIEVYFDGACFPINPGGRATFGFKIVRKGEVYHEQGGYFPKIPGATSNNVAEYAALKNALIFILKKGWNNEKIVIKGDSNLVIMQMLEKWKIKKGFYTLLALETRELLKKFPHASLQWVPRESNKDADALSKPIDYSS